MKTFRVLAESIVNSEAPNVVYASPNVIKESAEKLIRGTKSGFLIRSESDKFDYRVIQLENGIRILLISDPTYKQLPESITGEIDEDLEPEESESEIEDEQCDKMSSGSGDDSIEKVNEKMAAIVVAVKTGSIHDPKDIQGMAHFLEHLLTMGSEKFPLENEIDEFLSSRGGSQNAHTELEYTMYEIKVHPRFLKQAITMIGHAFVNPLLREESIEKEIKPIDSEFVEACNNDDIRVEVLLCHLANSDHPINKFMWGNRKSLIEDPKQKNIDIRKELVKFYETRYKPEDIVVVVQSQESLDNLEEWTSDIFSQVKSKSNIVNDNLKEDFKRMLPFTGKESTFNRLYYVESVNSGTRMIINWCLAPVLDHYLISPYNYWSSVIGYEGKGSLISVLRDKCLAIELFTNADIFCYSNNHLFCLFQIDIDLTDKGSSNLKQVIQLLFEYIAVIQQSGSQNNNFMEKQTIALNSFSKKSEKSSMTYSIFLAKNLMFFPMEHLLTGNTLYYHYDKKIIDEFCYQLAPNKANFMILNKNLKDNLEVNIEPWMNIRYQSIEIPKDWIENINITEKFHFPKPNPFIATNFELLSNTLPSDCQERKNGEYPVKIIDETRITVWHKADFKFQLPKASINMHILSPFNDNCLQDVALNVILQSYITVDLQEDTYDACDALLDWEFSNSFYGLILTVNGFNEKLAKLVFIILERFINVEISPELLETIKEDTIKLYKNYYQDSITLNREIFSKALIEKHHLFLELIPKIKSITKDDLIEYKKKLLSNISFEILVQGNISINETIEIIEKIKSLFSLSKQKDPPFEKKKRCVIKIPQGLHCIRTLTLTEKNRMSSIELFQQLGPLDLRSMCYVSLFIEIINEQCFHVLRTLEGLAYMVNCTDRKMFGISGFSVLVYSDADKFDCSYVESRIRAFLESHCQEFIQNTLTEEKFNEFVKSEITKRLSPILSLQKEVKRNWNEIFFYDYCFDKNKKEVEQFQKASLSDFQNWINQHIFLPWNERRMLTVQVVGNGNQALNECLTFDSNCICPNLICQNEETQIVHLLKSKNENQDIFISDLNEFRKNLQFYPSQLPLNRLI